MEEQTEARQSGGGVNHFNPVVVNMRESVGVIMLGLLSLVLLVALLREQARNRALRSG